MFVSIIHSPAVDLPYLFRLFCLLRVHPLLILYFFILFLTIYIPPFTLSSLPFIHLFPPFFPSLTISSAGSSNYFLSWSVSLLCSSFLTFVRHSLIPLLRRIPCLVSLSYIRPLPSFSTAHFPLVSPFHCSLALVISSGRQTRLCNSVALLSVSKWQRALTPRSKSRRDGGRNRNRKGGGDESGRGRSQPAEKG